MNGIMAFASVVTFLLAVYLALALMVPERVAKLRRMSEDERRELIGLNTDSRQFGILGEPRVNVLKLNIALDRSQTSEQSPND